MRRSVKWGLSVGVVTLVGCWLAAPSIIRWRIHREHPEVTVGAAKLGLGKVWVRDVAFDRKWVKGVIHSATFAWGGAVDVTGGDVWVDLDAKPAHPSESSGAGRRITFHGLTVHVVKGSNHADLHGVRSDGSRICWLAASAHADHPHVDATLASGCAEKDGSHVEVKEATLGVEGVPFVMPDAAQGLYGITYDRASGRVTAHRVVLDLKDPEGRVFGVEATNVTGVLEGPKVEAGTVTIRHPMLRVDPTDRNKPLPVTFRNVTASRCFAGGAFDFTINGLTVHVDPAHFTMWGTDDCQKWVDALPDGLRSDPLPELEFESAKPFHFEIGLEPKVHISLSSCRVKPDFCAPIRKLLGTFSYTAYDAEHKPFTRTTGAHEELGWTVLRDAGTLPMAVVNTEDPDFERHKGFVSEALENALEADVHAGRFIRGGSTIPMQLAKNLWLDRTKTLGRKAEEIFLAMALNSCLTKDEILEIYINVVEFGPGIYGIRDGAAYWFKKMPSELTPTEAFWLASILPHPERVGPPTDASLARAEGLMRLLSKEGRIPDLADLPPDDTDEWVANQ